MSWLTKVIQAIWGFLSRLFGRGTAPGVPVAFRWTIDTGTTVILGENGMPVLLTDTQKVTLSVQAVDSKGFATTLSGVPTWSVSDPAIGGLVAAANGLSAVFTSIAPGVCLVTAALGALTGTLDIQVEPGAAVSLSITAGAPVAQ